MPEEEAAAVSEEEDVAELAAGLVPFKLVEPNRVELGPDMLDDDDDA